MSIKDESAEKGRGLSTFNEISGDLAEQIAEPLLSESVKKAVNAYIKTMDDQPLADLYELVLCEVELPLLNCVLHHTAQNQSQTAQILGLNRGTLRKKMKKYGLL